MAEPEFRPRALLDRFHIEVISTTDSATSDLQHHAKIAADGLGERVFRPSVLTLWPTWIDRPGGLMSLNSDSFPGSTRRPMTDFSRGCALAGQPLSKPVLGPPIMVISLLTPRRWRRTPPVSCTAGSSSGSKPSEAEVDAFAANMLYQMAEMSCEDGLVMQIHPGVLRNHNTAIVDTYGLDKGYDIPIQTEFTRALRPMLDRFGTNPRFRVILFTVDETVYSRELAPIAGTYPSVRLGAPWWFLDSPEGMRRFRESAVETAGFYNTSGFVDDTRAFASIPARHDLSRRVDAGYLARLVLEHRLSLDEAVETAVDLAYNLPKASYARP